jgi:hypothetical protein
MVLARPSDSDTCHSEPITGLIEILVVLLSIVTAGVFEGLVLLTKKPVCSSRILLNDLIPTVTIVPSRAESSLFSRPLATSLSECIRTSCSAFGSDFTLRIVTFCPLATPISTVHEGRV